MSSQPVGSARAPWGERRKRRYVPDLRAYISQCEYNYRRLLKLTTDLNEQQLRVFTVMTGSLAMRIELQQIQNSRYTTSFAINQTLAGGDGTAQSGLETAEMLSWLAGPSMVVRLYHDAGLAEVLFFQKQGRIHPSYDYPNRNMFQPDEKAQLNRFLGDWLSHCLQHGQGTIQVGDLLARDKGCAANEK